MMYLKILRYAQNDNQAALGVAALYYSHSMVALGFGDMS